MDSQTYQAIAMSTYFVFMLLIGFWAYRRTKDFDDYMLAGPGSVRPRSVSGGGRHVGLAPDGPARCFIHGRAG